MSFKDCTASLPPLISVFATQFKDEGCPANLCLKMENQIEPDFAFRSLHVSYLCNDFGIFSHPDAPSTPVHCLLGFPMTLPSF